MDYELIENILTAKGFNGLRESVGWNGLPEYQINTGLKNSLITVSAIFQSKLIGMGRLVGDGVSICYVQDVVVRPEYQGNGVGRAIMEKLISYIKESGYSNTYVTVGLFAANGKEDFYRRLGFVGRPNENRGAGMEMALKV